MKFKITMKDPDGVYDSLTDAIDTSMDGMDLSPDEVGALVVARRERLSEFIREWVEYGEYLTVEFDDEAGTARVVPKGEP